MHPTIPMLAYEEETGGIGKQIDDTNTHHEGADRITAEYKPPENVSEHQQGQEYLAKTAEFR
ncbi:MAG: hypothetical protein HY742_10140 [Deltaproteobacteria bacterium]|nr:hypothetical protein [Deltaproteobacteria bacterium]